MEKTIFVNLPVSDLPRSIAFYEAIGFSLNPLFSNERAAGMEWSDTIKVMLLTHEFWRTFTDKDIVDAHRMAQVALCINLPSREAVDAIVDTAARSGGEGDGNPVQEHSFMYQRSFEDPDGHGWEPMWMDMQAFADNQPSEEEV